MTGTFGAAKTNATYASTHFENPRILGIINNDTPVVGFSGGKAINDGDAYLDNTYSVRAGFSIRPILVD